MILHVKRGNHSMNLRELTHLKALTNKTLLWKKLLKSQVSGYVIDKCQEGMQLFTVVGGLATRVFLPI